MFYLYSIFKSDSEFICSILSGDNQPTEESESYNLKNSGHALRDNHVFYGLTSKVNPPPFNKPTPQ